MPPERGGGPGAVVFQAGVGGGEDFHLVGGEAVARAQVGKGHVVAARFDGNVHLPGEELVGVEVDLRGGGDVALHVRAQVERLARVQPAGQIDAGDEDLRLRGVAQRHGVHLHAAGPEARGGFGPGVGGVVAVGEQHDAPGAVRRQDARREGERAADVRGRAVGGGGVGEMGGELAAGGGRLPDGRFPREAEDARFVVAAAVREARFDEPPRGGPRLGRDAGGIVHDEHDPQRIPVPEPAHPGQREDDAPEQQSAHEQAGAALGGGHVRQRTAQDQEQKRRRHRGEDQKPGVGEFHGRAATVRQDRPGSNRAAGSIYARSGRVPARRDSIPARRGRVPAAPD